MTCQCIECVRDMPEPTDADLLESQAARIAELTSMVDEHGAEMWKQGEEYAILSCKHAESLARIAELEAALNHRSAELNGAFHQLAALRRKIDEAPVVAWVDYQAGLSGTVINLNVRGRGKPLISKEDLA